MRIAVGTITVVTGLLVALGLTMLHSIGMHHPKGLYFFDQQTRWLAIGFVVCLGSVAFDYRKTRVLSWLLLGAVVVLLVLARTPGIGSEIKGAWRWLKFGPVTIQPSELAKVAVIMGLAAYAHAYRRRMKEFLHGFVVPSAIVGVILALVLLGKDLGTTALLALVSVAMLFAAGSRLVYLAPVGLAGILGLVLYVATDDVRSRRFDAFLHPEKYEETLAVQARESKVAIGSGGVTGRGLGNGIQKAGFVPEQPTDFIFSVIGEELGLRVTLPLATAYLAFAFAALAIARRALDMHGAMLAFGIGLIIGLQAALNIAVTTDSVPNKGLALPFVSYGGSCLVSMLGMVGLLINVALRSVRQEHREDLPESEDREAPALQNA